MSSAYGEAPDEEILEELIPELEVQYNQEFDEDIDIEPDPYDRNSGEAILYFNPAFSTPSEEKDFFEQIIAEELDAEKVNLLYSMDPVGEDSKGYEVWVK